MVRVVSLTSGFDHDLHYLISDRVVRPRWEGWTVEIEDSGPIGELPPQTMIGDDPKPLEANGGARGIIYFRIRPQPSLPDFGSRGAAPVGGLDGKNRRLRTYW